MKHLKAVFLGTGNAIPTKLRNHSSILVELEENNFLVDCGEGTQRQFRYASISPHKISALFITHWHGDHILGIPGLLQTLAMADYQKTLHIYGPEGTKRQMEAIRQVMLGIRIKIEIHEVHSGVLIDNKKFQVIAEELDHDIPTLGYSFIIKETKRLDKKKLKKFKLPNSPLLKDLQEGKDISFNGKKIRAKDVTYTEKGKKLTIILDTAYTESAVKLANNSDALIAEASFLQKEQDKAREYKHLTAKDVSTIAKKAKVKALFITHISQRYEHIPQLIEKEAKKIFKNTKIAKDLDIVEV